MDCGREKIDVKLLIADFFAVPILFLYPLFLISSSSIGWACFSVFFTLTNSAATLSSCLGWAIPKATITSLAVKKFQSCGSLPSTTTRSSFLLSKERERKNSLHFSWPKETSETFFWSALY